jgi:ankyrin repeat protein
MPTHINKILLKLSLIVFGSSQGAALTRRLPAAVRHTVAQIKLNYPAELNFSTISCSMAAKQAPKLACASWLFAKYSLPDTQKARHFSSKDLSTDTTALLIEAIKSGKKETLNDLIKRGLIDIHARYENSDTILHIAASCNASPEILSILIEAGASPSGINPDVNAKNDNNYTPLHSAVQNNNIEAVKILVSKYADPNITDNNRTILSSLLGRNNGECPLYLAQKNDYHSKKTLEIIDFLEPLTNRSLWFVITPQVKLTRAIIANDAEAIHQTLVNYQFSQSELDSTLLQATGRIFGVNLEIVNLLIDAGANVNAQDTSKQTALHYAVNYIKPATVKLLIRRKANPNIFDDNDKTPLDLAKDKLNPCQDTLEIIKTLEPITTRDTKIAATGSIRTKDAAKLLTRAIIYKNIPLIKQLLAQHQFNIDDLNHSLITACETSEATNLEIVELLLNIGANINTKDWLLGYTPLYSAVLYRNPTIVKLLLSKGANPNIVDNKQKSPLYIAQNEDCPSKEQLEIIKLLEPVTDRSLWLVLTPEIMLRKAVKNGNQDYVQTALGLETAKFKPLQSSTKHEKAVPNSQEELLDAWEQLQSKKSAWEILRVSRKSSDKEINTAYIKWVRAHHPDRYLDQELRKKATIILQHLNAQLR